MIQVRKEIILSYTIDKVWKVVTNNKEYEWRRDLSEIKITDQEHFIEIDKEGFETYFTITKKEEYHQYEFEIQNKNLTGHWTGSFEEIGKNKTKLVLIEKVEIKSFLMRLLAKKYLKNQQERYIEDLKRILEENKK